MSSDEAFRRNATRAVTAAMDAQRSQRGFLGLQALLNTARESGSVILDPFSTLISAGVELGTNNVIYPNVVIETHSGGTIAIGSGNLFYPGCLLLADSGVIQIGDENQFGGGGLQLLAMTGRLLVGNRGRYMNGADITAPCTLGSGTQILGAVSARDCTLGAGESYQHPNAGLRGGVLKGVGRAHRLWVGQGEVINGRGSFSQADVESQLTYHPRP